MTYPILQPFPPENPPSIPGFPAGYKPVQLDFEKWITDPLAAPAYGVIFRAEQTTAQSTGLAGVWTPLRMTARENPFGGWDGPSMKWTAPEGWDAWYTITVSVNVQQGAAVQVQAGITVSGVLLNLGSSLTYTANMGGQTGEATLFLAGGTDWVQPMIWSSGETDTDCSSNGRYPSMEIAFEST